MIDDEWVKTLVNVLPEIPISEKELIQLKRLYDTPLGFPYTRGTNHVVLGPTVRTSSLIGSRIMRRLDMTRGDGMMIVGEGSQENDHWLMNAEFREAVDRLQWFPEVVDRPAAHHEFMMSSPHVDKKAFRVAFKHFQDLIIAKSGHQFQGFHEGLAAVWESYKPILRDYALAILRPEEWSEAEIGSGTILDRTIESIEIQDSRRNLTNNLVFWQNRYGHANRDHHALLDARKNPELRREIERVLYQLFRGGGKEDVLFEQLQVLTKSKYPLLAYIFFLKDIERFMPIQPTGFDRAFRALSINFSTLQKCSWGNYATYNETLKGLSLLIAEAANLKEVRLVDAHSFCWIFSELLKAEANGLLGKLANGKDAGRVVSGRDRSIIEMRVSVLNTVKNANGQIAQKTVKNKELRMSSDELDELIRSLLEI